jgi:hypothetical protein
MKNRLHVFALVIFAISFLYDIVVWGGVTQLPDVGPGIADSARREAPLATTYIAIGSVVDSAIPSLGAFGSAQLASAWSDGFERIRNDSTVAMDLVFGPTWNATHGWVKTMYWAAPIFFVLSVIFWVRRPKQIRVVKR